MSLVIDQPQVVTFKIISGRNESESRAERMRTPQSFKSQEHQAPRHSGNHHWLIKSQIQQEKHQHQTATSS